MATTLEQGLAVLGQPATTALLTGIRRGIEKESLRAIAGGQLSQQPHPAAFGAAMTHASITTDFSEALLEFITPVNTSIEGTLAEMDAIHRFAYSALGEEFLWNASMPCSIGEDDNAIPVAKYGSSNPAQMKTRYRLGLGHRYGRKMQTIAGIHYNFSLPDDLWRVFYQREQSELPFKDFVTRRYFGLIRNFRRYAWLLVYLFGAAPAVSRCFLHGRQHNLQQLGEHTLYKPWATSLRMGNLGYQSDAQKGLNICYNKLDNYINTLRRAIVTSHPAYENFPADQQLSTGLLQIENEFYSPIRPKRVTLSGEIPLGALQRAGVEYIEVRCLDVNPMLPLGIDAAQMRFVDAFLLYCLLEDSPECDDSTNAATLDNMLQVVDRGRDPSLTLVDRGEARSLRSWANALLADIQRTADLLDQAHGGGSYRAAWQQQCHKVEDPEATPSAQIVRALENGSHASFHHYAMARSLEHAGQFRARGLHASEQQRFAELREQSLKELGEAEAAALKEPFDTYLQRFYAQYREL